VSEAGAARRNPERSEGSGVAKAAFGGVSEAGAARRNPERSEGSGVAKATLAASEPPGEILNAVKDLFLLKPFWRRLSRQAKS
jgi:hypothetical protein